MASTLTLAKLGDAMEFEALSPGGTVAGIGGKTNFNGAGFEAFSWAAGHGASTKYPAIFATSHVPTIHPIMAAKQAQTIDHITGGRFALNIVTGWHRPEIEMFGASLLEHDNVTRWLRNGSRSSSGSGPKMRILIFPENSTTSNAGPSAKADTATAPSLMNAGGSERGRHFAAKNCDVAFVHF